MRIAYGSPRVGNLQPFSNQPGSLFHTTLEIVSMNCCFQPGQENTDRFCMPSFELTVVFGDCITTVNFVLLMQEAGGSRI